MPRKIILPAPVSVNLEFAQLPKPNRTPNLNDAINDHMSSLPTQTDVENSTNEKAHYFESSLQKKQDQHEVETEKQLRELIELYRDKIEQLERTAELKLRDLEDYIERRKNELERY